MNMASIESIMSDATLPGLQFRVIPYPTIEIKGLIGRIFIDKMHADKMESARKAANPSHKPEQLESEELFKLVEDGTLASLEALRDRVVTASIVAVYDDGLWRNCKVVADRSDAIDVGPDGEHVQKVTPDLAIVWIGWLDEAFRWQVFNAATKSIQEQIRGELREVPRSRVAGS